MHKMATLFERTRELIEAVESNALLDAHRKIITDQQTPSIIKKFYWYIAIPFSFIRVGAKEIIKPLVQIFVWFCILSLPTILLAATKILSPDTMKSMLFLELLLPFLFVSFASPSTYGYFGITTEEILDVIEKITALGFYDIEEIDLLLKNIDVVKGRVFLRIKVFNVIIATAWATAVIVFNQFLSMTVKIAKESDVPQYFLNSFMYLSLFGIAILFTIWMVLGYQRAVDKTFKRIEFACNEIKFQWAD